MTDIIKFQIIELIALNEQLSKIQNEIQNKRIEIQEKSGIYGDDFESLYYDTAMELQELKSEFHGMTWDEDPENDVPLDGDHDDTMRSIGWGMDEDYCPGEMI